MAFFIGSSIVDMAVHEKVAIIAIAATLLTILASIAHRTALPTPIPGIPHNAQAARHILGDVPAMQKARGTRFWMLEQFAKHNSPIVQIFVDPLRKPRVLVSDFVEAHDVLTRRTAEFDKSSLTADSFAGVVAESLISMKSPDRRFRHNKELMRDLMTPSFLHEVRDKCSFLRWLRRVLIVRLKVSAPEIYDKVVHLLELWTIKMQKSKGRPFQADKDIYNLALDIIVSAAFDFPMSRTTIVKQIAAAKDSVPAEDGLGDDAEPFTFSGVAMDAELQACVYLTESIGVSFQSTFPRLAHWLYLNKAESRRQMRLKEQLIRREINKAIDRMERGDGMESSFRCAVDQLCQRERAISQKHGVQPNYHQRAIYDEVDFARFVLLYE